MKESNFKFGYDQSGQPCDFIDEDGILWIYQGRKKGIDEWGGFPLYD